jgi:hypothetical protein
VTLYGRLVKALGVANLPIEDRWRMRYPDIREYMHYNIAILNRGQEGKTRIDRIYLRAD